MIMEIVWWTVAALSVVLNLLFFVVWCWCPATTLGPFRRFLFGFIVFDIVYAVTYVLVLPTAVTKNGSMIIFAAGVVGIDQWGHVGILCFCGLLIVISLLILNCFIFKYIHMCRLDLIPKYHSLKYVLLQLFFNLAVVVDWVYTCGEVFEQNSDFVDMFANITRDDFDIENITRVGYMGTSTELIVNSPKNMAMFGQLAFVTFAIFYIMIFCSRRILGYIEERTDDCEQAHELHLQTLHLLLGQCALPIASLLTPILLVVGFTAFSLTTQYTMSALIGFCFSIFPLLNPIVKMSFIKEYKMFIMRKYAKKTARVSYNAEFAQKYDAKIPTNRQPVTKF